MEELMELEIMDFSDLIDALNPDIDNDILTGGSCHGGGHAGCKPPPPPNY